MEATSKMTLPMLGSRSTFLAGVLAFLLFVIAWIPLFAPIGPIGVCLVSIVFGGLKRPSFAVYSSGILAALVIFSGLGLLFGDSSSAVIFMVPLIAVLVFLYAGVAFFIGRFATMLWSRIASYSARTP